MDTIETYAPGTATPELIASQTSTTTYDWQADPPTVTTVVTDDATGDVVSTETVPIPEREVERHEVMALWQGRRQAVVDTLQDLLAAEDAPDVISAVKDHSVAVGNALGIMERLLIYVDSTLQEMAEEED